MGIDASGVLLLDDIVTQRCSEACSEVSYCCARSTASSAVTAIAERQHVVEEAQRSELLGSQGKRAARPQAGAESTLSALFGGKEGHGKHDHHESASQDPEAASDTGTLSSTSTGIG